MTLGRLAMLPYRILIHHPGVAIHEALHAAAARLVGVQAQFCGPHRRDCLDGRWHVHLDFDDTPDAAKVYFVFWAPWLTGLLAAPIAITTGLNSWLLNTSPIAWAYLVVVAAQAATPSRRDLFPLTTHNQDRANAETGREINGE
jgi:hypothetical protein